MSLHSRIKEARVQKGLTQAQLGEQIGMAKTTVTGWEKDREPTAAQIGALADILEIDVGFLLQDEVKKRHETHATPYEMDHLVKKYRLLDDYGKEAVDNILDIEHRRCTAQGFEDLTERPRMVEKLVYVNPAAAGTPLYAESDFERMEFPESEVPQGADFGIRISGHSMEPTIPNGEIVWVYKTADIQTGKIGIFMLDSGAACKRLAESPDGKIYLESDNPDKGQYPPIAIGEFQDLRPVGQVLGYK